MARKKKSRKSVVPHKLQIPLAIVLGIVFILMLNSRLKSRRTAEGRPAPAARDEVVPAEVQSSGSESRVDVLIDKLTQNHAKPEREVLPRLPGDPFVKPKRPAGRISNGDPEHSNRAQEQDVYDGQSRDQFLQSLTIQATLIDGDKRFVLINGTLFAEKDSIGAFKIVEIGERAASLSDERGSVLLKMKGDDLS